MICRTTQSEEHVLHNRPFRRNHITSRPRRTVTKPLVIEASQADLPPKHFPLVVDANATGCESGYVSLMSCKDRQPGVIGMLDDSLSSK